ncbi:glycosyltransferase family 4 protein [Hirschia litorea]|uniref:Glycosyltransferase family 4 protein n=1 Tax=Hirschia litorea TaxID=1199156 RepID=A0ABW2IIA7_9PROT
MSNKKFAINGSFLHRDPYAESLVAQEYLRAFYTLRSDDKYRDLLTDLELYLCDAPHSNVVGAPFPIRQRGNLPRPLWQQMILPSMASDKFLLSFCNIGPMFKSNAAVFIHDANVYESPISFSANFVRYTKFLNKMMGRNARRIYTVSSYSAEALQRHNIAQADHIKVIHNGVDHVLRTPSSLAILEKYGLTKNGYVLGLSNSYKHKNMRVVMDVFDPLKMTQDIEMPLVLFGPDVKETFQDEGIESSKNVIFTGYIPEGERRALYENALCFVYPSKHDGFALTPAEALRLGCPVIATRSASIPEICGDSVLYVSADNSNEWHEAIISLRDNAEMRAEYCARGPFQTQFYTWDKSARNLLDDLLTL